jgi:hypothetical protein
MRIENKIRDRPIEVVCNREKKNIFILCKQSRVMYFLRCIREEHDIHNQQIRDVFEYYI